MFSMFCRTGAPQNGPHKPENVGEKHNIFWPVRASLWRVGTFESSLGAARHSVIYKASEFRKSYLESSNSSKNVYSFNLQC